MHTCCNLYLPVDTYFLLTSASVPVIRHRPVCRRSDSGSRCPSAPFCVVWSTLEPRTRLTAAPDVRALHSVSSGQPWNPGHGWQRLQMSERSILGSLVNPGTPDTTDSGSRCPSAPYWAVWTTLEPRTRLTAALDVRALYSGSSGQPWNPGHGWQQLQMSQRFILGRLVNSGTPDTADATQPSATPSPSTSGEWWQLLPALT